jgi:hypothetical protein
MLSEVFFFFFHAHIKNDKNDDSIKFDNFKAVGTDIFEEKWNS